MQLSPPPFPPTPDSLGPYVAPGRPHLEEVGRQHAVPVAVVEGERGGEAGHGDAVLDARAHRFPPRVLDGETQSVRQQTLAPFSGNARYRTLRSARMSRKTIDSPGQSPRWLIQASGSQ